MIKYEAATECPKQEPIPQQTPRTPVEQQLHLLHLSILAQQLPPVAVMLYKEILMVYVVYQVLEWYLLWLN